MDAFEIIRKTMGEFADVPDDTVQTFISLAEPLISKKRFRKLYPQALAYLAAHKMKMSGLGKTIGIGTIGDTIGLSSVSEGETSVSFSNNQAGNTATDSVDCQHFFRQIFLGYFPDIVQAFDTLGRNVYGDDYTSLHNPIVLSSVLLVYGMFHSTQILF